MKLKSILIFTILQLWIMFPGLVFANEKIEVHYDTSSSLIFSNTPGAVINKGKFVFNISHKDTDMVDIMVSIENTNKDWRFNKVKLQSKDGKFYSENFSIDWDGVDKENKPVISGHYNIKIFVVDAQDNSIEDNNNIFNVDNAVPDIRKVEFRPDENNLLRIEAQIFDDSKIGKVSFQYTTKMGSKEEVVLQANADKEGDFFAAIPMGSILNISSLEGTLLAKDKAMNASSAKVSLTLTPDLTITSEDNKIYFNADVMPYQFKIEGKYSIGNLKVSINDSFENTYELEGKSWIKKVELKNTNNDKIVVPAVSEVGTWEADINNTLSKGDNRFHYIYTDYLNNTTVREIKTNIIYDIDPPRILKGYMWAGGQIMVDMSEKVKIVSNKTLFEIDMLKADGSKTTVSGSGRLINNDINIEIQAGQDLVKGEKIVIRMIKLADIADNTPDKIESEPFIYDK